MQIAFWNETGRAQLDEATKAAETALALEPEHGGALALLENLYRRQRSWDRYVEVLARRRQLPGADPSKLVEAYREVLRYEPRHAGALGGLARVHEESGEWDGAAEAFRQLVAVLPEGAARIEAQYQLAKLLTERLRDPRAAEEQLALALAGAGGEAHVPSLLLLAAIYRERKDWLKARQLLGRAAAAVTDVADKTRILGEAAEICATALDDEVQAADLYTRDPGARRQRGPNSSRSWPRSSSGGVTSPGCSRWRSCWRAAPRRPRRRNARVASTVSGEPARRPATRGEPWKPFEPPRWSRAPRRRPPRRRWPRATTSPTSRSGARTGARPPPSTRPCSADPEGLPRDAQAGRLREAGHLPASRREARRRRSSRWRRPWRSIRAARARCRRWSRRLGRPATTTPSYATPRRCWRSPTIRGPSWGCWSTWRRSTASVATTPSGRSRPIWRRSRSGRTSGQSCTGCSSSTPTPSSGSSLCTCWSGWRPWPTMRRARRTSWLPATSWPRSCPRGPKRSMRSSRRWTPIRTTSRPSSASTSW